MATKQVVNVMSLIGSLSGRGRDYTAARDAFIAREAILGTKQVQVAKESGVDKSDVNRIYKKVAALPKNGKVRREVGALNPNGIDVDKFATLSDAIRLGAHFARTGKVNKGTTEKVGAPAIPTVDSGQVRVSTTDDKGKTVAANVDAFEAIADLIMSDPKKYLPMLDNLSANMHAWAIENGHEKAAA